MSRLQKFFRKFCSIVNIITDTPPTVMDVIGLRGTPAPRWSVSGRRMPPFVTGSWYAQPAGPTLNTASLDRVPPPFQAYWPHVGGVLRSTGIPFLHPHIRICLFASLFSAQM